LAVYAVRGDSMTLNGAFPGTAAHAFAVGVPPYNFTHFHSFVEG
jgi:hypothetical protein